MGVDGTMEERREIRCLGCGQNLHTTMGQLPTYYGLVDYWVECELCGKQQKVVINILRVEPDWIELLEKGWRK